MARWLADHYRTVWWMCMGAAAVPGLWLLLQTWRDALGSNPLATLLHTTGRSALWLLAATLLVTPLRRWSTTVSQRMRARHGKRLADWNWLIRLRRPLGLWSFAYAAGHAGLYAWFDLDLDAGALWRDLQEKPYLQAGLLALVLLLLLALTSHTLCMRWLGRRWRPLHRSTYAVAVLVLLHFWWLTKPGLWTPWPETLVLGWLLAWRLLTRLRWLERWDGADGSQSAERPSSAQTHLSAQGPLS